MAHTIFIAGAGGIGEAAAILLREWSEDPVDIYLGDISEERLLEAKARVVSGSSVARDVECVLMPRGENTEEMRSAFDACDVFLDCAPGGEAPRMAAFAKEHGMHYANLTEYVAETDRIMELAKDADTGFILQTAKCYK